jgi:hypothetical protein
MPNETQALACQDGGSIARSRSSRQSAASRNVTRMLIASAFLYMYVIQFLFAVFSTFSIFFINIQSFGNMPYAAYHILKNVFNVMPGEMIGFYFMSQVSLNLLIILKFFVYYLFNASFRNVINSYCTTLCCLCKKSP